jgi:hypothetical protein
MALGPGQPVQPKTRHRTPEELLPLPAPIEALVAAGRIKDARLLMPVHLRYGDVNYHWAQRSLDELCGVCVHHSAGTNDNPVLTAIGHASPGDRITRDHRGSPGLNYTFAVTALDQPPLLCNDIELATWSQGFPANKHLVAILVMGCFTAEHHPTLGQLDRLWQLISDLQGALGLPQRGVFGHADFGKPACPGPALMETIAMYRASQPGLARPEDWQRALCAAGFPVEVDGAWGPRTLAAMRAFRSSLGQKPTGQRDALTEAMLLRALERSKREAA